MTRLLLIVACLLVCVPAFAQEAAPVPDPLVALDTAKLQLGDGRLEEAQRQLAQVPPAPAEPYIDEEVALQQMLLDGAFLDATHFLIVSMDRQKLGASAYAGWLRMKRDEYASNFATHARRYLELTAGGHYLSFVRFRLPLVNEDHLRDVELYSDPQVLSAATKNWDEGREGLGKGLILAQARVAVALNAAVYYDLPHASAKVADVSKRLTAGVPIHHAQVLDWIASMGSRLKDAGNGLDQLARGADERIIALTAAYPTDALRLRAEERRNPKPKVEPKAEPKAKPAPKKKRSSKKKRRRR